MRNDRMSTPNWRRRRRAVKISPVVIELELRTLLATGLLQTAAAASVPIQVASVRAGDSSTETQDSSSPSAPEETLNVQVQPDGASSFASLMPSIAEMGGTLEPTSIAGLYEISGTSSNMGLLAAKLNSSSVVQYAAPVQMMHLANAPNDTDYVNGDQWQLTGTWGVNPLPAWNVTTGSDQVIVADVDTGLNYNLADIYDNVWLNQPEIPASVSGNLTDVNNNGLITFSDLNNPVNQGIGKILDSNGNGIITAADVLASTAVGGWVNPIVPNTLDGDTSDPNDFIGWNYVNNSNNPMDDEGHGTFTAAEIGEMTNNTVGGAGLVWNTQIMPVKFLDSTGNGTDVAAAEAIDYAVNHGADVINASWGGGGPDPTIGAAIQYADQHNVIVVAAAGNNGADDDTSFFAPASYSAQFSNVITVAASDANGARASFSNYGVGTVQLAAPGVGVFSAFSYGGYGTMEGTSMAAPLVTGAVALVEAAHPTWTMSRVIDAVLDTVTPSPALAKWVTTGGVLNVGAAVANTDGPYVESATPDGLTIGSGGISSVQVTFNEEINPATFTTAQITLTGPAGVIPANELSVTAVSGSNDHTFQVSFPSQTTVGTYSLTVGPDVQDWYGNDMNQNRNSANGETSDGFTDTIQLTDRLNVTGVPAMAAAGTSETISVMAIGPNGAVDSTYLGTVHFTSTDSHAVLPANYTFTQADGGAHVFTITLKTAGAQSITATDTATASITGSESSISVQPAAARTLTVKGLASPTTAGTAGSFTVTAYDQYGNIASGYVGTIQFTSSDSLAVLPGNYTFTTNDAWGPYILCDAEDSGRAVDHGHGYDHRQHHRVSSRISASIRQRPTD